MEITKAPKTNAPEITSSRFSAAQERILMALGETAILRGGEAGRLYLKSMTLQLSKESSVDKIIRALESLSREDRADGQPAAPTFGRVLREVQANDEANHPLRVLREIVRKLAANVGAPVSESLLRLWQDAFGHRTDADLEEGYKIIIRNPELRHMPTTGQFQAILPLLKQRRDGSKVQ